LAILLFLSAAWPPSYDNSIRSHLFHIAYRPHKDITDSHALNVSTPAHPFPTAKNIVKPFQTYAIMLAQRDSANFRYYLAQRANNIAQKSKGA